MARLTPFSRLLLVLGIIAGLFFLYQKFRPQIESKIGAANTETPSSPSADNGTTTEPTSTPSSSSSNSSSTGTNSFSTNFSFTPPAPEGGKLKGVVELGATGFNSFIIRIDNKKNWKLEKSGFGSSLVYEKLATDEDVKAGLKNYIAEMLGFGVGPKDIHFVISSGAKKVDVIDKIIATLKGMGFVVNTVTAEQEAKYALKSALPSAFTNKAFVVDIGSGNTKISWVNNGGSVTGLESYGAKYFQNGTSDSQVAQEIKNKCSGIPSNLRETCFIIGGVPYELAKQSRNGKERYTSLKSPDAYKAEGDKQKSGLNIYKAIADATGCKQFVFDWDANFTIGFLLNM